MLDYQRLVEVFRKDLILLSATRCTLNGRVGDGLEERRVSRVVCIEDESDMLELMRLLLTRRGFEFVGASDGKDGLLAVREQQPDLILLDLMMPEMDGWEVYNTLRADPATREIPVIVVTARARTQEQLNALRVAKVEDYIVKPFGPVQLIESIERVLSRQANNHPAEK